jgi:hypothetical protein
MISKNTNKMKKSIFLLIVAMLVFSQLFSQKSEYRYVALKFGMSHGFSPAPGMNVNKYLYTPVGEMQLSPTGSTYVPGFVFDLYYHFDFVTDNAGIYTGLEYNYSGLGAKYDTKYGGYNMKETNRYHSIGVPLAFKYGPDIWKTQRYLYVGAQLNFILAMNSVQEVSWLTTPANLKLTSDEFNRTAFNLFFGINYAAFNFEFDFYPKSIYNTSYQTDDGYKPFSSQANQSFLLKTSINIPYGWLSQKSFWWRKVLRNTPWR